MTKLKKLYLYIFLWLGCFACLPKEEIFTTDPNSLLVFSNNAVIFDTIFTDIPTITKRIKVYNPHKNALKIQQISLGGQQASPYQILINGKAAINFPTLDLLGGDSLLILVNLKIPATNNNDIILAYDSLIFNFNNQSQNIKLVAWGQNANIIKTSTLPCNTIWTNEKPYIIYDSVLVEENCTLTIQPGTTIYAYNDAHLKIKGTLQAEGNANQPIKFLSFRKDKAYENVVGQWQGISFLPESKNNKIAFAEIKNATVGISLTQTTPDNQIDLLLQNVMIYNMLSKGLIASNADIKADNCLIHNCVDRLVEINNAGNYTFRHCTLTNFEFDFNRNNSQAFFFSNQQAAKQNITFENSILWGSFTEEISIENVENINFNLSFNLLKTQQNLFNGNNNILNSDPSFTDILKKDFTLTLVSPARDTGNPSDLLIDLKGNPRDAAPDRGAYELQP